MLENAVKNQPSLKSLFLPEVPVNDGLMYEISKLKHLEELDIGYDEGSVTAINKLSKVKYLALNGEAEGFLQAFATLNNAQLKKLKLFKAYFRPSLLLAISASMPNLKKLFIATELDVVTMNIIMHAKLQTSRSFENAPLRVRRIVQRRLVQRQA